MCIPLRIPSWLDKKKKKKNHIEFSTRLNIISFKDLRLAR